MVDHDSVGPASTVQPEPPTAAAPQPQVKVRRTRVSWLWIGVTLAAVVLLLLLVFILQNDQLVSISFLGLSGSLPLGVALLLAAICGVLLVAVPGTARIIQLRRTVRKAGTRVS